MKQILSLLSLLLVSATAVAADPPKNIVLILADDLGWADTTLYGKTSLYETPNIERLAARGMTFSRAYASPICSPTRASIMTGQNPARHGMTAPAAHLEAERFDAVAGENGPPHQKSTNVRSATRLAPELPFLSQVLKDSGYSTAHFGKWHLGREPHSPLQRGFDVDLPHWWGPGPKSGYLAPWGYSNPNFKEGQPGEHIEDRMAKEAVAWLKNRDRSKPFFMNYWQFSVHAPFGAKPELIDYYRKKLGDSVDGLADSKVREKLLQAHQPETGLPQQCPTYAAMVHSLDDAVGSLLDALDEEGIADETVIIFYSDNGGNIHCGLEETAASGEKYITAVTSNHPLRGGKGGIHEGGVRVPAVVVWPGVTKTGSRSDVRIQSNDLYPTILRMLNIERPRDHVIDGVDFAKALRGDEMNRGPMFTHVPGHGNTPHWLPPSMSVHHGDWKLIRTFHHGEDGKHDYRLYNLREDIGEHKNLAIELPDKVNELDRLIEDYIAEANVVVPLLNPNFDPAKFDLSQIGVQAGGLKMPPGIKGGVESQRGTKGTSSKPDQALLGWSAKNADAIIDGDSLIVSPAGRQPFIANARVNANGPVEVRLRIRTQKHGMGRLQWRTEGQDSFPETGQRQSFEIFGGDWQELSVPLDVKGRLIHLRLFLADSKRSTEIDWIEIGSKDGAPKDRQRWNFKEANSDEPKPPRKPIPITTQKTTAAASQRDDSKPNVLFIAIDDLNDWTDTLKGNPQARTPHMNRLAAKGMLFANAHCAAPACGPSRAAIMSGIRPSTSGNYINKNSFTRNPILNNSVLLPEFFQQNGYYVCGGGKLFHGYHFNEEVKGRGFDEYFPSKTQDLPSFEDLKFSSRLPLGGWARQADWGPCHPDVTVDDHPDGKTTNWAKEKLLGGELQEPFFLGAGIFQPHLPNYAPQEYFDRFPLEEIKLPEGFREDDLDDVPAAHARMAHNPWLKRIRATGQWKPAIQAYLACTSMVDDLIGQIIEALENSRYAGNTIIVLWSDHGFQLGEKERWAKYSLWERATRVNLVWVAPGVTTPGTVTHKPANLLDIYPTLASLTGLKPPKNQLEGNDLSVLMKNPDAAWHEATVTTFGYRNYGVRSKRYRYIVYEDGTEELYDHAKDKWEWKNLADNPEYAAVKKKMRQELPSHHELSGVTYEVPKRKRRPR